MFRILSLFILVLSIAPLSVLHAQKGKKKKQKTSQDIEVPSFNEANYKALTWRNIGPFRGGRSNAVHGVLHDPLTYYMGSVGGGLWKTENAGNSWTNISDGYFASGSVGAIAVAASDANIIYVGMGEHAVRGVMTSHGDGIYKSTDAGQTWKKMGLEHSRHISAIRIHPQNPNWVYVAVQGSAWADSEHRGIYMSSDGGENWTKILYVNESTGAADLSMDTENPRVLYAGMWDHRRKPWQVRSGGPGSGFYKSIDGGLNWEEINKGLPEIMGKVAIDVSASDPDVVYANIEAEGDKGGVYRSTNGAKSWSQQNKDRVAVARAWYYTEVFADPTNANQVYVLNAPLLKSIDGGRTLQSISNPHTDQHDLWINPSNPKNMILGNDGGACITFDGGKSWSTQNNQPTAQFYRVITDNQFPYHIYGGQQDNSTVCIPSRTMSGGITDADWYPVAGGESAFIAFDDPNNPQKIYGTSIQGFIDVYDKPTKIIKDIMEHPAINLGTNPEDQKYRWNWNGPIANNAVDPSILYHGAQVLFKSTNGGFSWEEISPDLTKNDPAKHTSTGVPFTNEAAGGEVYNTISYIAPSPHDLNEIWVGCDDGNLQLTRNHGKDWIDISPVKDQEVLVNALEISPHQKGKAYAVCTRYKFEDQKPYIYVTEDYGNTWNLRVEGLDENQYARVVREDPKREGLLYAGTESGLYISFDDGLHWSPFQLNMPICPITDLIVKDNDLVAATSGRAFWILDDLSSIQQSAGALLKNDSIALFAPKDAYRFTRSNIGPGRGIGENPQPGVLIDFYLATVPDSKEELTLEILDADQEVIRTFSNQKDESLSSWMGGPSLPITLSPKAGMNRMNWDLRREGLMGVDQVFLFGNYTGSLVGPGEYEIRLTLGEIVKTQKVRVLADPRIDASAEDYALQQDLLEKLEGQILDIHDSVNGFRSMKDQMRDKRDRLEGRADAEELIVFTDTLVKKMDSWESDLIQTQQKTFQDVINFENKLSAEMMALRGQLDSRIPQQTDAVINRIEELSDQWTSQKQQMQVLMEEGIRGFNEKYKALDLPAVLSPWDEMDK